MDRINGAGHVNHLFVSEDAETSRPPTEITDAWLNGVQEEVLGVIEDQALTPDGADLKQMVKAIKMIFQKSAPVSAAASGTVDAITANYTPAITALTDHLLLIVRAGGANTSTTPTFTPASATIPAKTIVKGHNLPLAAGDISGAGFRAEFQYDLTLDKWVLLNPATGVTPSISTSAFQSQTYTAFATGGATGAFTLTPAPAIGAYAANQRFRAKFHAVGNGADTINVSGLGAKNIKQYDSTGAKVAPVIVANQLADIEFDGTDFVILDALPAAGVQTAANNTWTKAQRGAVVALADGATITPDFSLGNNFSVTLGGNRTLANPSNLVPGQSGVIAITQDATGSRTQAYGSYFKFAGGAAPILTTTANATDELAYYVETATRIVTRLIRDVK